MSKTITIARVLPKPYTRNGVTKHEEPYFHASADIVPGKSMTLRWQELVSRSNADVVAELQGKTQDETAHALLQTIGAQQSGNYDGALWQILADRYDDVGQSDLAIWCRSFIQEKYGMVRLPSEHEHERNWQVGDTAEYDSYNLSYYGKIVSITDKTVVVEEQRYGHGRKPARHRLDLYRFATRNRNWSLEWAERNNHLALMNT